VVWEPSWLQQQLIRTGHIDGPINGLLNKELFAAARSVTADCGLPLCTAPMAPELSHALGEQPGEHKAEDLRGQFVDQAISAHRPRRLITLAPTLREDHPLETLVAAYCPPTGGEQWQPTGLWRRGRTAGRQGRHRARPGPCGSAGGGGAPLLGVVERISR